MTGSAPSRSAVSQRDGTLVGTGGIRLHWQAWLPEGTPRAVVVVAHGAAEHGGRYRHVVERLVPAGFALYAIDHRGHGRSGGPRAYVDRLENVVADFDRLVDVAADEHPGVPVFLLGHSFGGCVAVAYALRHQDRLRGLAISAPVALISAPAVQRLAMRALTSAAPRLGVHRVDSAHISRDPAEVSAYDDDPLVYRGKLPARTVHEMVCATRGFPGSVDRLSIPLLVMQGTADRVVEPAGASLIHERAGSADKTLKLYEGFFHEIFNEPAGERDRPLGDLVAWLEERS
jgi:acylglycerol lipase